MGVEIKDVVDEFVKDSKLFTSVDISNKIKDDGEWISNRAVSQEISYLFKSGEYPDYKVSSVQVERAEDKVMVRAILYMPDQALESDYKNITAKPMTPKDFDFNHTEIDLDLDVEINDEEDENMKDEDKKIVKDDKKDKPSFTKSKRNYRKFNFL